jgi:hypothetical protein
MPDGQDYTTRKALNEKEAQRSWTYVRIKTFAPIAAI